MPKEGDENSYLIIVSSDLQIAYDSDPATLIHTQNF